MPSISHLPILQVISDDNGDDGEEKEGSEGSEEVKIDGSSSSSSSSEFDVSGDDDDEDDEGPNKSGNPRFVASEELEFQGGGAKEEREVDFGPIGFGSIPHHRRVHINA